MGSLYKRRQRDGSRGGPYWCAYYRGALQIRESTGTRDLKAARDFLKRREGDLARGLPVSPRLDRIPYAELSEDLLAFYTRTGKRNLDEVEDRLAYLDRFFSGDRAIALTPTRINAYVDWRRSSTMPKYGRPPANRTINLELALLKRMLRLAVRHGRIAAVPYIEMLAEPPPRQGFFEDGPYQAVQRRLAEDLQVVVAIAKTYGWRADSEILPLRRREHLDLTAGTLRLDPGMAKNDEGRLVVLIPEIYAALAGQVERVEALSRRLGRVIPWLFPHLTGRWAGAQRKGFRKAWATACRTAGVPGRLVHDLRRTAVRDMDRSEVGRSVAMKMTGHKTESVYRRYAIVSETDLREAAAKLAASTTTSTTGGFSRTPRSANSRNS